MTFGKIVAYVKDLAAVSGLGVATFFVLGVIFCLNGDSVNTQRNYEAEEAKPAEKPSPMPEDGAESGAKDHSGSIPDDPSVTGHIFDPKKGGHLPEDTPENRKKLDDVGNDEGSYLGRDQYGNDWHGRINEDGSQTWTESRNGRIFDGDVNKEPKTFDPKTGLKFPERPW